MPAPNQLKKEAIQGPGRSLLKRFRLCKVSADALKADGGKSKDEEGRDAQLISNSNFQIPGLLSFILAALILALRRERYRPLLRKAPEPRVLKFDG
jgi:hypothetical protein